MATNVSRKLIILAVLFGFSCAKFIKPNIDKMLVNLESEAINDIYRTLNALGKDITQLTMQNCSFMYQYLNFSEERLKNQIMATIPLVTIYLKTKDQMESFSLSPNVSNEIMASKLFNKSHQVTAFVTGFTASINNLVTRRISNSLALIPGQNVLVIDHSRAYNTHIVFLVAALPLLGDSIGKTFTEMRNGGVKKFHVIGFSVGGNIATYIPKAFKRFTGDVLDRVTNLESSGPCTSSVKPDLKLDRTDAKFVDGIHTNEGVYGDVGVKGHVDFYVNGGVHQDDCLTSICSHNMSWQYFHESFTRPNAFPAVQCSDWETFQKGGCENNHVEYMGYYTKPTARGTYFLRTNSKEPFGMSKDGIIPSEDPVNKMISLWNFILKVNKFI